MSVDLTPYLANKTRTAQELVAAATQLRQLREQEAGAKKATDDANRRHAEADKALNKALRDALPDEFPGPLSFGALGAWLRSHRVGIARSVLDVALVAVASLAILRGGCSLPPIPFPPGPAPAPTPTPGPKPTPVPTGEKLHVTILYDDSEMTPETAAIRRSQKLRDYLKAANAVYFDYEIHAKDLAGKNFEGVISSTGTPALVIQGSTGQKIAAEKLPTNVDDVLKFIHDKTGR